VQYGMQTFDQAIMKLYKQGMISFEEAMNSASNPDDFDLRLRGIMGAADRWGEEHAAGQPPADTPKQQGFSKY
jgi:Tfp pilus assembly ATPase PilU